MVQSRPYIQESRPNGFKNEELKIYWNIEQIEALCPKDDSEKPMVDHDPKKTADDHDPKQPTAEHDTKKTTDDHDPSDEDVVENLKKFPTERRKYKGEISYINEGIEKAVFNVPEDAQIILLNFAVKWLILDKRFSTIDVSS